ncbi:hypothetical protein XELAEV_18029451mg [Xenopus laevis]|uniref:Uncharacterized protein n=1 Tax=Xenopus laevis TaxID=8355 RepID=A0A974CT87_XENLA|nr:hypothetical protein XELAEV_18029451mg [Xenopus laevis]
MLFRDFPSPLIKSSSRNICRMVGSVVQQWQRVTFCTSIIDREYMTKIEVWLKVSMATIRWIQMLGY